MEEYERTSLVSQYYIGKGVFITGGTGFIGKVLIEKLLRSCPKIGKIFLLLRPKKSQDIEQRLQELISNPVYDRLRKEFPDFGKKLHAISGDISLDGCGVSNTDAELLHEHVNIVFHSAATIRFDEHLRFAMDLNVLAVRRMIKLFRPCKNLEAFIHLSTAYANCDRPFIEEMIYNPSVEPQRVIDALEWMDDEMITKITPKLIGNKPNTYTFTKQLGEYLLVKEGSDLPLAIVRPSIVGAAWKEPHPGWVDNLNGPSGLYIAAGKGLLKSVRCDFRAVADMVPVDMPVNMLIAVAWHTAVSKPSNVPIYHCTTGSINPVTWGEVEDVVMNFWKKVPLDSCFRRPKITLTNNSMIHDYWVFVSHLIPAYFADLGFCLMGKRPRMVKIYNKLHRALGTYTFFTTQSWEWTYSNLDMLKSQLTPEDKKLFYFDPRGMNWATYLENYCLGTKKYVLNEDLSGLPAARRHLRNLRNIRYTFNTVLLVALWRVLIARSEIARNLWFFIMGLVMKFVKYFRITSTIAKP